MGWFKKDPLVQKSGIVSRVGVASTESQNSSHFLLLESDPTVYILNVNCSGTVFDGADIFRAQERMLALTQKGDQVEFLVNSKGYGVSRYFSNKSLAAI